MRTKKNLLTIAAVLACCVVLIWLSTSIKGGERTYEVRPEIGIPEYRTDAARAIDAYERLMERYMDLTEGNLIRIGTDIQGAVRKLDSIDSKLTRLSTRMARIERALGLEKPTPAAKKKNLPEETQKKSRKTSLPPT
ncbi:MAG: hypothetical protein ACYS83_02970 [Planctomycetota bacterium]|jgi:hypothetical protein